MTKQERDDLRTAIGNYISATGCGCCASDEKLKRAEETLAYMLGVPMYTDASGFDWKSKEYVRRNWRRLLRLQQED